MSKSSTTTDTDWLHNPHAGEILLSEFMEPLELDTASLANAIGVNQGRLNEMIVGGKRVSAELDLRLTRYLGLSEGFFLRLQDSFELRGAKRTLNGELERIAPRAA